MIGRQGIEKKSDDFPARLRPPFYLVFLLACRR